MRQRRKYLILAAALFFSAAFCPGASAGEAHDLFKQANAEYEKGDFAKAAGGYQEIIDSGLESANLYYNLGNAYFRSGKIGMAVLSYKRAMRLDERDSDIRANYDFARTNINETIATPRSLWDRSPAKQYADSFTVDELMTGASALYMLTLLLVLGAMYKRHWAGRFIFLAVIAAIFMAANLLTVRHKTELIGKEAVIVTPSAECHYGPVDSTTVFFTLPEGSEVDIVQTKDDWRKVQRADGKTGWVKRSELEVV